MTAPGWSPKSSILGSSCCQADIAASVYSCPSGTKEMLKGGPEMLASFHCSRDRSCTCGKSSELLLHTGGLSLILASGGYSLLAVCGLLIEVCSSKAEMCMVHFHGHDNPVLSSGARGVNKRDTIPASRSIQSGGAS